MTLFRTIFLTLQLFATLAFSSTLENYTEQEVSQILHNEIPSLDIHSVNLISTGWDNMVADINGEWIFRFPRSETFLKTLEREHKLLARLHDCVSLPIPYYQYVGQETQFVGYRKIQGIPLDEELYESLSEDKKNELAETMATFIIQIQNCVSAEEAREWGYEEYHVSLNWIKAELLGTLPKEINQLVSEALDFSDEHTSLKKVFTHNDLHGDNLAVDETTYQLNGIFDFSDAVVADYTVEFGKLYNIHPDLALRTAAIYAAETGLPNPAKAAAADFILRRSMYILNARNNHDQKRERVLENMLKNFIETWHSISLKSETNLTY
jgi:aminoglycoside 2''-phosphotransferase